MLRTRTVHRRPASALALVCFGTAMIASAVPAQASAQTADMQHRHTPGMSHDSAMAAARPKATRAGQEAFATIAEVVRILEADPHTDWAKVDIEALRQHLIDMDDVTMRAVVRATPTAGGVVFDVQGTGRVREAIRRMALSHGATITPADGFTWIAATTSLGARVTVRAIDTSDTGRVAKLRAMGFHGILSLGDHHTVHHVGIADGSMRGSHKH